VNTVKFSADQGTNIYHMNKTFSKSKSLTQYAPAYNTSINLFIDTENRNTPKNDHPLEACHTDTKPRTSRSPNSKNMLLKGCQPTKKTDTHQQDTNTKPSNPPLISSHSQRSKNPWNLKRNSVPTGPLLTPHLTPNPRPNSSLRN
jgi:hypothetical protein